MIDNFGAPEESVVYFKDDREAGIPLVPGCQYILRNGDIATARDIMLCFLTKESADTTVAELLQRLWDAPERTDRVLDMPLAQIV